MTELEPKIEDAGVRLGAVEGWRLWGTDGHRLFSLSMQNVMWLPGVPMTGDPGKALPGTSVKLGVYAFSSEAEAYQQAMRIGILWDIHHVFFGDHWPVLGRVKMWGRIFEHESGYRAEFARITVLKLAPPVVDIRALNTLYLENTYPERSSLVPVTDERGLVGVSSVELQPGMREFSVLEPPKKYPFWGSKLQKIELPLITHIYRVDNVWRTADRRMIPGIRLARGQDPKHLPGWLPLRIEENKEC